MSEVKDETIVDLEERALVDVDRVSESLSTVLEETFGENVTDISTDVTYNGVDPDDADLMRLETVTTYRLTEPVVDDEEEAE